MSRNDNLFTCSREKQPVGVDTWYPEWIDDNHGVCPICTEGVTWGVAGDAVVMCEGGWVGGCERVGERM